MHRLGHKIKGEYKEFKRKYSFLEGVSLYVQNGGSITHYAPDQNYIFINLDHVKRLRTNLEVIKRFGKIKFHFHMVIVVLLHEIYHVYQELHIPPNRFKAAHKEIEIDKSTHSESWIELEADAWARKEYKKWRKRGG